MEKVRIRLAVLAVLAGALSLFAAAPAAVADNLRLHAVMTGSQESPPNSSPAVGQATVYFPRDNTICVLLRVSGLSAPATGAHIHRAPTGNIVVPLTAPTNGFSFTCRTVSAELLAELRSNPSTFYVNVHSSNYPAGEIRGFLSFA